MTLKRVYNQYIPFPGYLALTVIPWIFIREKAKARYTNTADRHEHTHGYQQIEMLIVGLVVTAILFLIGAGWWSLFGIPAFFELYFLEWIIKIPLCSFNTSNAYKSISFEQEAYEHEDEVGYNHVRHHYAWVKYIFSLVNC